MDIFWIIFFLAGIALIGIGIYAKIHRYRMMHEGRYFNQSIAFYIDVERLRQIGEMLDTYDFTALCNDQTESDHGYSPIGRSVNRVDVWCHSVAAEWRI